MTVSLKGAALDRAKKEIKEEAVYFANAMAGLKSVEGLVADKRAITFLAKATGVDPKALTADVLRKAFASDPADKKSYVNKDADARVRDLVSAFSFDRKGMVTRRGPSASGETPHVSELSLHQTLEEQEGDMNDGVRLALYFERKAPTLRRSIRSWATRRCSKSSPPPSICRPRSRRWRSTGRRQC